jgi:hypothetical protein
MMKSPTKIPTTSIDLDNNRNQPLVPRFDSINDEIRSKIYD